MADQINVNKSTKSIDLYNVYDIDKSICYVCGKKIKEDNQLVRMNLNYIHSECLSREIQKEWTCGQ